MNNTTPMANPQQRRKKHQSRNKINQRGKILSGRGDNAQHPAYSFEDKFSPFDNSEMVAGGAKEFMDPSFPSPFNVNAPSGEKCLSKDPFGSLSEPSLDVKTSQATQELFFSDGWCNQPTHIIFRDDTDDNQTINSGWTDKMLLANPKVKGSKRNSKLKRRKMKSALRIKCEKSKMDSECAIPYDLDGVDAKVPRSDDSLVVFNTSKWSTTPSLPPRRPLSSVSMQRNKTFTSPLPDRVRLRERSKRTPPKVPTMKATWVKNDCEAYQHNIKYDKHNSASLDKFSTKDSRRQKRDKSRYRNKKCAEKIVTTNYERQQKATAESSPHSVTTPYLHKKNKELSFVGEAKNPGASILHDFENESQSSVVTDLSLWSQRDTSHPPVPLKDPNTPTPDPSFSPKTTYDTLTNSQQGASNFPCDEFSFPFDESVPLGNDYSIQQELDCKYYMSPDIGDSTMQHLDCELALSLTSVSNDSSFAQSYLLDEEFVRSVAAIVIQTNVRCLLARKKMMIRLGSLITIQSIWRKYIEQIQWKGVKYSATLIQSAFRGWWCRDSLFIDCYCATQLQKIIRGYLATRHFWNDILNTLLMQSEVRKQFACRDYLEMDAPIISSFRGYKRQKKELVYFSSAVSIQSWWRGVLAQYSFQIDYVSVIICQSAVRRFLVKRSFQKITDNQYCAAVRIQSKWRSFDCQLEFMQELSEIIIVQSVVRRWIALRRPLVCAETLNDKKCLVVPDEYRYSPSPLTSNKNNLESEDFLRAWRSKKSRSKKYSLAE